MTPLHKHQIHEDDMLAVSAVLMSDRLTQGAEAEQFREALSHFTDCPTDPILTCNGTAALMAAYWGCGVRAGDHVLVPANTYVATANAARLLGAHVDYVDCSFDQPHMSLADLEKKLRYDTKLVVSMDYAGIPGNHALIREIIPERCRHVVDACHSFGAWAGALLYADAVCTSFHPSKIITTGEGGAVFTTDPDICEEAWLFTENGRWLGQPSGLGLNLRMSDMQASLGRSQLRRIDQALTARALVAAHYWEYLDTDPILAGSHHLCVIQHDDRNLIKRALLKEGIQTATHYPCLSGTCPEARRWERRSLSLPIYPELPLEEVERICGIVNEFYREER